jgi:hypothetical protein
MQQEGFTVNKDAVLKANRATLLQRETPADISIIRLRLGFTLSMFRTFNLMCILGMTKLSCHVMRFPGARIRGMT